MPAFLTALEMAFTAVHIAFSSVVSSPVPLAFLPSSSTNLVKVTALVSTDPRSDMTADFKILADVKKIQNLAVNNTVSIIMSKSCNTFSRGDKNYEGGNAAEKGVWRAKPMRTALPEVQRCDWLTAWKFQNNDALWMKAPSCLVCAVSSWSWVCPSEELLLHEWKQFRVNGGTFL